MVNKVAINYYYLLRFHVNYIPELSSDPRVAVIVSHPTGGTGCVLMVYGLNAEKMNCERIFNLFCLYGNVVKVITEISEFWCPSINNLLTSKFNF